MAKRITIELRDGLLRCSNIERRAAETPPKPTRHNIVQREQIELASRAPLLVDRINAAFEEVEPHSLPAQRAKRDLGWLRRLLDEAEPKTTSDRVRYAAPIVEAVARRNWRAQQNPELRDVQLRDLASIGLSYKPGERDEVFAALGRFSPAKWRAAGELSVSGLLAELNRIAGDPWGRLSANRIGNILRGPPPKKNSQLVQSRKTSKKKARK